ncbi:hypothetical protein [Metabacillus sediminilitoris]|uniref:Uncharacterized protein n=1 Tax=Metabacillus sediminilitoris TaxID=2567941 RepID=A0A4S4BVS6_9BACI|nr:hypothetical protein [Metabacillus sediminilitoris]QGQ46164.1 hypothetical protein GMB29_13615 [Metabacillus sediminilitoris]THF79217.1 hypothetical protein E6W99_12725 [Metabacillus sediminilitoris]
MLQSNLHRVIVGSVIIVAASTLLPVAKETLKPLVGQVSRQMRFFIVSAKEGIEDMVAEAKVERMKRHVNHQFVIEYNEMVEDLAE